MSFVVKAYPKHSIQGPIEGRVSELMEFSAS